MNVRIHTIRRRPDRRRPFEVRWHAGGRARSRSFITRGMADRYRAELIRAARQGLDFSARTGEPASWATRLACHHQLAGPRGRLRGMKWPLAAAHTRAGIADALATVTPALLTPRPGQAARSDTARRPLRARVQPGAGRPDPGQADAAALTWARHHCLPLAALADPAVTRRALDTLALRLDGSRAAAATITRKRAVFHGCLGYAAELGLLASSPLERISWRPPGSRFAAGPLSAATPAQVLDHVPTSPAESCCISPRRLPWNPVVTSVNSIYRNQWPHSSTGHAPGAVSLGLVGDRVADSATSFRWRSELSVS